MDEHNRVYPSDKWIGFYYWSDHWHLWDKIVGVTDNAHWIVVGFDTVPIPGVGTLAIGRNKRAHLTPLNAEHLFRTFWHESDERQHIHGEHI